ncbi:hypothetical protein ACFLWR_04695 [Chloroflexota bacterium]
MSFLNDTNAYFLGLISNILGLGSIFISVFLWIGGYLLPWGIIAFIFGLFLVGMGRAFLKRS